MRNLLMWLLVASASAISTANAATYSEPTVAELRQLPSFCTARLGPNNQASKFQEPFHNTLHYCMGRTFLNRYYSSLNSGDKATNLGLALNELTYLVEHWYPDYPAADIFLHRGIVFLLMKKNAEAITDLNKALSHDPKLVRTYITLANIFDDLKQRGKALEVVADGLRHVPENKTLQRRYKELGGKPPYPEPLNPPEAAQTAKNATETARPQPEGAGQDAAVPAAQPSPAEAKPAEPASPKIGSPTNPWCRFCPDSDPEPAKR